MKALSVAAGLVGMIALPAFCLWLGGIGPAARVVYSAYLPVEGFAVSLLAAPLGASLGVGLVDRFRRQQPSTRRGQWLRMFQLVASGILIGWFAFTQLSAFPASASVGVRDAWARANVPQYAALVRVIYALPAVQRDVGRVIAVAPTATDQHRAAREMNGDSMRFTLEVIGERGRGMFHANCTLDESRIYDWQPARWIIAGREQRIDSAAAAP